MPHAARRRTLHTLVEGPILLLGNGERSRNLPMNKLPFRQDSTFWYFTGCALPEAAAILEAGKLHLFLPAPEAGDALWHGPGPSLEELGASFGADTVSPIAALQEHLVQGMQVLAVADEQANQRVSARLGVPLAFGRDYGSEALVDAVIHMRRRKDPGELSHMREAARVSALAHRAAMASTHPGGHERHLTVLFEAVLGLHNATTGYDTILSQAGEILHNHHHDQALEPGRMVLLDGGGELIRSGYGVDITRTWPVSGVFSPRQRGAYEAVLSAQAASIALCREGVRFREVHRASCLEIARFLCDEGLLTCSAEVAVEIGAHALFFPHGVGHHLGLDVHDLENFGDRASYPKDRGRPQGFGTKYLRLDLPLEAGWVVTVEPGFYVVPAILHDPALREQFRDVVDWERAESWLGFGGVRLEDDLLITEDTPENLTHETPKSVAEVEALVGSARGPVERLWSS